MPQIMDATALRDGGPRQCSLECRGVQSMPRGGDAEEVVGLAASGKYAARAVGGMEAGSPAVSTGLDRVVWPSARAVSVGGVRQPTVRDGRYRWPEGAAASTDADCAQAIVRPGEDCRRLKQCLMTPGTHGIFQC
jgi:hypothetical protein